MKSKNTLTKTFLALGLSLLFFNSKALTTPEREIASQVEKRIQSSFIHPDFLTGEQKVEILFTTGDNAQVNFVLVKTNNQELKKEIEKQFYQMSFPLLTKDAVNSVVLSFKNK